MNNFVGYPRQEVSRHTSTDEALIYCRHVCRVVGIPVYSHFLRQAEDSLGSNTDGERLPCKPLFSLTKTSAA